MENNKYVSEKNWQRFRIFFLILAIVGIALVITGVVLVATSGGPFKGSGMDTSFNGAFTAGIPMIMFGLVAAIAGLVMFFKRQISGAMTAGVMPVATEAINTGAKGIAPAIGSVVKSINDAKASGKCDKEELLAQAKSLKDRGLIDDEEYKEMRKSILNIK